MVYIKEQDARVDTVYPAIGIPGIFVYMDERVKKIGRMGAARKTTRTACRHHRHHRLSDGVLAFAVLGVILLFPSVGRPMDRTEGPLADFILVEKALRKLTLFSAGIVLKEYRISLGKNPEGHKMREGDDRTPEGFYQIDYRNENSTYHRSLRISYPDEIDEIHARRSGVPPGGNIMIHGIGQAEEWVRELHPFLDWTEGCIAVTDSEIDEIWQWVPIGTWIEIRP